MAQIGFGPTEEPEWSFTMKGKQGRIVVTVTPNGFYLYEWLCDTCNERTQSSLKLRITQSDRQLPRDEVEAKALQRQDDI
jgi:hypothetical protein